MKKIILDGETLTLDEAVRVLFLQGAGDNFLAGADIVLLAKFLEGTGNIATDELFE